jgi:23S rRNA (cytosine1962-C5)-methyltransferase
MAKLLNGVARPMKALSLFGHTGLGTLAIAAAGAEVTHVDASRQAVAGARENQNLSGLSERPIRWIVEDAMTFVKREARRGNQYDALILYPPRFGRGPNGEIWKLEEALPELLVACEKILSAAPAFVLLTVYATVLTRGRMEKEAEDLRGSLKEMLVKRRMPVSAGALVITDTEGREIVASVYARAQ